MTSHRILDLIPLRSALVALLPVAAGVGWRASFLSVPALPAHNAVSVNEAYRPAGFDAPMGRSRKWEDPSPQRHGAEWIYDVFTPPAIYYHAERGEFSVYSAPPAAVTTTRDFGLELVGVRREPFRLQLVGFVGGEGNYLGAFENILTAEHFLAREGRRVPALGVSIVDFKVQRMVVDSPDSMPVSDLTAVAVVRDERTGEMIELNSRERGYEEALIATLVPGDSPEERTELRPGEEYHRRGIRYKLREARLMPPAADVARESADSPFPEIKTLVPRP